MSRKDFFISYNQADQDWAEWIAWILEEEGYSVVIQAWDFRPGENFVLEMHKAAINTEKTIALFSQCYLDAEYTHPEWAAAFKQDSKGEKRKLIPFRVRECQLNGLLAQIIYHDLSAVKNGVDAKAKVLAALKERAKPDTAPSFPGNPQERVTTDPKPFPGEIEPANNIPYSNARHFVDREEPTEELHVKLRQHSIVVISDVMGKGGVGKTELAVQYCRKHLRDYPGGCCWLYPDRTDLLTQLLEFAYVHFEDFQLPDFIESNEGKIAYCWKKWQTDRTLLIFDNVTALEAIQPYLPTGKSNFKVLITTRRNDLPYPSLPLGGLPQAAAQELLGQLLGGTEAQDKPELALQLCEFVGHIPLGIYQIAALRQPTGGS